ncbi:MAG: hypothetical protein ACREQ1_12865, partial [Woeseiaceae bacterium]
HWDHPWNKGAYIATPVPGPSRDDFRIGAVSVRGHGGGSGDRNHLYEMKIREADSNGCPKYVDFLALQHEGGPVYDDPGHAGTGR